MTRLARLGGHYGPPVLGALVLCAVLVTGGLLYASGGGGSRDLLVTDLLVTTVIVMGLQLFVGNTGVLSLGHMAFAAVAAYTTFVLAASPVAKAVYLRDAPWGLGDVQLTPAQATAVAVALVLVLGVVLAIPIARAPAVTATMITVAILFVTHAVILNWNELTNGAGGMAGLPRLQTRSWVYAGLVAAVVGARTFRRSRWGRFAAATAEDATAAAAVGVDVVRARTVAFLVSLVVVAVGAALRVQSTAAISPRDYYFEFTLLTLAMVVVGGRRSVTGTVVGVTVIFVGQRLAVNLAGDRENLVALADIFLGGSILGIMLLRPQGLLGDWELDEAIVRWWQRRRRTGPAAPGPAVTLLPPRSVSGRSHLVAEGIGVSFGGFLALVDVSLEARSDEIVGLIGPNGAGKTTLLNVLTGVVRPLEGRYLLDGRDLTGAPSHRIARAGLARTFQNLRLFPELTVRENVAVAALGAHRYRRGRPVPDVEALLAAAGLTDAADRRARTLDYGSQRKLELARAAALGPSFLLLDEPTSGMSDAESTVMIEHVRATALAVAAGVVVIDHDLHFITSICDRIVVLDQGEVIATGTPAEIRRDPRVVAAYLGTAPPVSGTGGTPAAPSP